MSAEQAERFARILGEVRLGECFPLRPIIHPPAYRTLDDSVVWRLTLFVPDRDTGQETRVTFQRHLPAALIQDLTDEQVAREVIWNFLFEAVEHEAREGLYFHGDRILDPHR